VWQDSSTGKDLGPAIYGSQVCRRTAGEVFFLVWAVSKLPAVAYSQHDKLKHQNGASKPHLQYSTFVIIPLLIIVILHY